MTIFQTITEDMKDAMKEKNELKLQAIRSLYAAAKQAGIEAGDRDNITDDIVMPIIKKQVKQRKESIKQFIEGDRKDLAEKEEAELTFLEKYLPEMMGIDEIKKVIKDVKGEIDATSINDIGKLMGAVMKALQGKPVDGSIVKDLVKDALLSS